MNGPTSSCRPDLWLAACERTCSGRATDVASERNSDKGPSALGSSHFRVVHGQRLGIHWRTPEHPVLRHCQIAAGASFLVSRRRRNGRLAHPLGQGFQARGVQALVQRQLLPDLVSLHLVAAIAVRGEAYAATIHCSILLELARVSGSVLVIVHDALPVGQTLDVQLP